MKPFTADED